MHIVLLEKQSNIGEYTSNIFKIIINFSSLFCNRMTWHHMDLLGSNSMWIETSAWTVGQKAEQIYSDAWSTHVLWWLVLELWVIKAIRQVKISSSSLHRSFPFRLIRMLHNCHFLLWNIQPVIRAIPISNKSWSSCRGSILFS